VNASLVLNGHGFGVDGFLAGYAFQSGEGAAVVVLSLPLLAQNEKWGTRLLRGIESGVHVYLSGRNCNLPLPGFEAGLLY
jgi:hypothetical protein